MLTAPDVLFHFNLSESDKVLGFKLTSFNQYVKGGKIILEGSNIFIAKRQNCLEFPGNGMLYFYFEYTFSSNICFFLFTLSRGLIAELYCSPSFLNPFVPFISDMVYVKYNGKIF